ncbi:RRP15-like protein [Dinothrombium tinctorium]|uniref:RRP15-like protein n=1 Tax=Dinothrombium tinctorium TaxID=1965070 RepID=A0A3S4R9S5_9ACAR|nr:RRP15-like protein [Dinothrombium tinctorium]RWS14603.1 RRP15-like protein [Dinothrombium tinctorium]
MATALSDCIQSILNSNPSKKRNNSLILSKALKDRDIKEKYEQKRAKREDDDFQLIDESGNVKSIEDDSTDDSKQQIEESTAKKKKKKIAIDADVTAKVKPVFDERERDLNAIATKGVVQLFNTVRQQQKTIEESLEKAGPSERIKDKTLSQFTRNKFLDKLKENEKKETTKKNEGWKALKDDFLTDAKLKHWDNDDDDSSENSDNDV